MKNLQQYVNGSRPPVPCDEVQRTVVYTVTIVAWNSGAWYRDMKFKEFNCILEIAEKQFGGQEIMFKVLNCFHPVKYIKQQHCTITDQHLADHSELLKFYGK
jgi:hypothetical protein